MNLSYTFSQVVVVNHNSGANGVTYTGCNFDYYYSGSNFTSTTGNSQNKTVNFQAAAGTCLSVTFFVISLEGCCDFLRVTNGLNQGGTQLAATAAGGMYVSNTGVLSFRFTSDASGVASGWYAKINCTCPTLSDGISQNCLNALPFCSSVGGTPVAGNGGTDDMPTATNKGCLSTGEKPGAWYEIVIQNSGTLKLAIDPAANHDFDFALYGPNKTCGNLGGPIRCSYSPPAGTITGIATNLDNWMTGTEGFGVTGASENNVTYDDWVTDVAVTALQRYYLYVGDYTVTPPVSGFQMTLGGSAGFSCNLALNVKLYDFQGVSKNGVNYLNWITASEVNNSHFVVERTIDGYNWETIATISGAGNSSEMLSYNYADKDCEQGISYYRLKQIDYDGKTEVFDPISVDNSSSNRVIEIKRFDIMGKEVSKSFSGIVIIQYSDGSIERTYAN
jgi:hypothetical protein